MSAPQQPRPAFTYVLPLAGQPFRFTFKWNSRFAFWVCDVALADGTLLVAGAKLVVRQPLWAELNDPRLPVPLVVVLRTDGGIERLERATWGSEAQLLAL